MQSILSVAGKLDLMTIRHSLRQTDLYADTKDDMVGQET